MLRLYVARKGGKVKLNDRGTGAFGFTIIETPADNNSNFLQEVAGVTLDSLLDLYKFNEISILKMDIEGAEVYMFEDPTWLRFTNITVVELHERIVKGCERLFFGVNRDRYIYTDDGEKYFSVGLSYFNRVER